MAAGLAKNRPVGDREMNELRPWVSKKTDTELYFGIDDFSDEHTPLRVESVKIGPTDAWETDDKTALCTISHKTAIRLMDGLWEAGIRPTNT